MTRRQHSFLMRPIRDPLGRSLDQLAALGVSLTGVGVAGGGHLVFGLFLVVVGAIGVVDERRRVPSTRDGSGRRPYLGSNYAARGPAPWGRFCAYVGIWAIASWVSVSLMGFGVGALVTVAGAGCYWFLLPRSEALDSLSGIDAPILIVTFIGGIFLAGSIGQEDRHALPAAYGVWFIGWIQLGLWLRERRSGGEPLRTS